MAEIDNMISDFSHDFKSYVKNHQLLCERGKSKYGWVFWSGEDDPCELPPPPLCLSDRIYGTVRIQ
ncbi:hypothetical protein CsSME_00051362 [Camellia sinensis var. sinensis]